MGLQTPDMGIKTLTTNAKTADCTTPFSIHRFAIGARLIRGQLRIVGGLEGGDIGAGVRAGVSPIILVFFS